MSYQDNKYYKLLTSMLDERYLRVYNNRGVWYVEINGDTDNAYCGDTLEAALEDAWIDIQYEAEVDEEDNEVQPT